MGRQSSCFKKKIDPKKNKLASTKHDAEIYHESPWDVDEGLLGSDHFDVQDGVDDESDQCAQSGSPCPLQFIT